MKSLREINSQELLRSVEEVLEADPKEITQEIDEYSPALHAAQLFIRNHIQSQVQEGGKTLTPMEVNFPMCIAYGAYIMRAALIHYEKTHNS